MIIAIDHGNSSIKTPDFTFTSGLIAHNERPPTVGEVAEYKGRFYTLSEERIPYLRDKTSDERFFVLTLFAAAKTLESNGYTSGTFSVDIAAGLPPEHYKPLQEAFACYLKGEAVNDFTYNGRLYRIRIEHVYLYPQGFASIVPLLSRLDMTQPSYLLDIGGYTADVLFFRNGKPDLTVCTSLDMGTIVLCNQLMDNVNARFGLRITEEHIQRVLTGGKSLLPDSVCAYILDFARQYADSLLAALRERQIDLVSNRSYFSGGGALLLKHWLEYENPESLTLSGFMWRAQRDSNPRPSGP